MNIDPVNEREFQEVLALGVELGTIVACLDEQGQVLFFHPDDAGAQARLTVPKVARQLG